MSRLKVFLLGVIAACAVYIFYYCWVSFPIATGYGAKVLSSAVFVSGREEEDVIAAELNFFPVNLANFAVNYTDSTITADLFGVAKNKAIYKSGLGSTLVNDFTEREIRLMRSGFNIYTGMQADSVLHSTGSILTDGRRSVIGLEIGKAVEKLFMKNKPVNSTRALVILHDGKLVAEKYAFGVSDSTRLAGWSMTKSITGALIGILVHQYGINIDDPAPVPEWRDTTDPRHFITLRHLLQQSSGLDFEEVYNRSSHANKMLFQRGDAAAFAASQPLAENPGEKFSYSSGNSNILSRIIRHVVGEKYYHRYPYERLFSKIGMQSAILETDATGTFVGSSFCYATARDWARFGLLYYNNGRINNEQLLPADWIQQSLIPAPAAEQGEYGFQWWLNRGSANDPQNRLYPELPADMYFADGYEGQNIFIIPSEKLVVVRLGLTRSSHWRENEFLRDVIKIINANRE